MIAPALPAATLILLRDRPGDVPELLMVRRSAALAFAGGAWVFPGGRVDAGDVELATKAGGGEETAARIAAIRETIEEVAVAVGLDPVPGPAAVRDMQARLLAGKTFAALLAATGARLEPTALVPFARWLPPATATRRFDTRFYLARIDERLDARTDGGETLEARWTSAQAMLDEADAGNAAIILPTRANLRRLADYRDFAAAAAAAAATPVRLLETVVELRDGRPHVCVPAGFDYPDMAEPLPAA